MWFKRLLAAALVCCASAAAAQTGVQFPAGTIWANDTAATRPGKVSTMSSIFDRAFTSSTAGTVIVRGVSLFGSFAGNTSGTGIFTENASGVPSWLVTGTGVATALAVNVGTAGSPVINGGALGTPSSGVATNLTGTASGLTAGTATNAVNSGITNDTTTNATMFPTWVTANTGNLPVKVSSTKWTWNPSTGAMAFPSLALTTALPVSSGGTGAASFTAFGVIIAGTTSTNPFSVVAGSPGNASLALVSQGAASPPIYTTLGFAAITGWGTGVTAALAINVGTTGAFMTDTSTNTVTNKSISATTNTISMPYFAASLSASTTGIASAAVQKVNANTEQGDSNNWYDNATNFRFTPQLAGRYKLNGNILAQASAGSLTELDCFLYFNGSVSAQTITIGTGTQACTINKTIQFNGTTDFVEMFGSPFGGGTYSFLGGTGPIRTWFEGQYLGP